jgi:acyl carrier protein
MNHSTNAFSAGDAALIETVVSQIKQMLPASAHNKVSIDGDLALTELGLSSMGKISLVYKLEQALGIDLSDSHEAVADIVTVRDVVGFVRAILARRG